MEWRYQKQREYCGDNYGGRYYTGNYRWRAKKWTGGNIKDSKSFSWGCHTGSKVTVQSTVWAARTSTSRSWAQFSIAGIGLDAEQINSSYHKLTLDPVRRTHACGNNGDVLHASRVKEVV